MCVGEIGGNGFIVYRGCSTLYGSRVGDISVIGNAPVFFVQEVVAVEEVGFPFCVGSGGTEVSGYGYAVGETMKKYTIEVVA